MGCVMRSCLFFCAAALLICQSGVAQESSLKSADTNSDGKLTVEEFKEYAEKRLQGFDKVDEFVGAVDADGNGEISETEFGKRRDTYLAMRSTQEEAGEKASEEGPLAVGDKATDFELQSIGEKIKLSDRFGDEGKPVVVVFSRANW